MLMLAFYNKHLTFHANYGAMLVNWITAAWQRYIWMWPPRPLMLIFVPSTLLSIFYGIQAFFGEDEANAEDEELAKVE